MGGVLQPQKPPFGQESGVQGRLTGRGARVMPPAPQRIASYSRGSDCNFSTKPLENGNVTWLNKSGLHYCHFSNVQPAVPIKYFRRKQPLLPILKQKAADLPLASATR